MSPKDPPGLALNMCYSWPDGMLVSRECSRAMSRMAMYNTLGIYPYVMDFLQYMIGCPLNKPGLTPRRRNPRILLYQD